MTDATTYRPDDWPPERAALREAAALRDHERRVAALEKAVADLAEAVVLLAENDDDLADGVRNERLRHTIQDRADEARSCAEAPEDGAEGDRA